MHIYSKGEGANDGRRTRVRSPSWCGDRWRQGIIIFLLSIIFEYDIFNYNFNAYFNLNNWISIYFTYYV